MKKVKYVCDKCGGSNLQIQAWVDMNTYEYISETDDDEIWCDDCEEFVTTKEVKE